MDLSAAQRLDHKPRGRLVAIGGAEDKTSEAPILRRVLELTGKPAPRVGVITTASAYPEEVFADYLQAFERLGAGAVLDISIRERADAEASVFIEMIDGSDAIFIAGGDQMRLTSIFGASTALKSLRARYQEGAVIAGTSAGAACQCTTMVYGGKATDSLRKGTVKMTAGFGLIEGIIIDTHFLERGRFSRLMEVGATNPEYLGVGLSEDSAALFENDKLYAFGAGHVILVDSSEITSSNVFELDDGEAVSLYNVKIHALVDGDVYSIVDRHVLKPEPIHAPDPVR